MLFYSFLLLFIDLSTNLFTDVDKFVDKFFCEVIILCYRHS